MSITRMIPELWDTVNGVYQKVADAYPETIAHGTTLEVGSRSCQIMSDIWGTEKYATYWDDAAGRPKTVVLDVCDYSYAYGDKVHAEVDATEEVYAKLRKWLYQQELARATGNAEAKAAEINKDSVVKVVAGRNGKGTVGKVVVSIVRPYNAGWRSSEKRKFGIALDDVKVKVMAANGKVYDNYKNVVWAWEHNCELVNVPAIDMKEVEEIANEYADKILKDWRKKAQRNSQRLAA